MLSKLRICEVILNDHYQNLIYNASNIPTTMMIIVKILGDTLNIVVSTCKAFTWFLPGWYPDTPLYTAYLNADGSYQIPFLISMGWVFFFTGIPCFCWVFA